MTNVCETKDGRKEQPDDSPRSPFAGSTVGPSCPLRQGSYLRASYPEGNQVYLSVLANFPRESSSSLPYDGERQVLEFFLAAPATLSTTVTADTCLSRCRFLTVSPTLSTAFTRGRCYAGCCWDLFNVSVRSTRTTLEQTGFYPVSVITVDGNCSAWSIPLYPWDPQSSPDWQRGPWHNRG